MVSTFFCRWAVSPHLQEILNTCWQFRRGSWPETLAPINCSLSHDILNMLNRPDACIGIAGKCHSRRIRCGLAWACTIIELLLHEPDRSQPIDVPTNVLRGRCDHLEGARLRNGAHRQMAPRPADRKTRQTDTGQARLRLLVCDLEQRSAEPQKS